VKYHDLAKHLIVRRFETRVGSSRCMGVHKRGTPRGHDPRVRSGLDDITERFLLLRMQIHDKIPHGGRRPNHQHFNTILNINKRFQSIQNFATVNLSTW
jgi:hypothetical protein